MNDNNTRGTGVGGMTLTEMLVAMSIMAVVFGALLPLFRNIYNSWDIRKGSAVTVQNGRVLVSHLRRKLSGSRSITAVSAASDTAGFIEYKDCTGTLMRCEVGPDKFVRFGRVGNLSSLAGPVSGLRFVCYGLNDLDTPTMDVEIVRMVKFEATFTNPGTPGHDETFVSAALLHTNGNVEPEDTSEMLLWLKLDDHGGMLARDSSDQHNHGHVSGGDWQQGHIAGGLHLDGVSDFINVPSDPTLNTSGDVTFSGWFKLDSAFNGSSPTTMIIMDKFIDTSHDMLISLIGQDYNREVAKGALLFKIENGPTGSGTYRYVWTNQTNWSGGVWYHFVAILDSNDHSNNSISINGLYDTSVLSGVPDSVSINMSFDADINVGGRYADPAQLTGERYFKGCLDDIRIFNRILTWDEVAALGEAILP